jgi:heptosyltransferase-2
MVDNYLELAYALGCPRESRRLELATTAEEEASAAAVFEELALADDGRVIALNCSGAYGESKLWPVEYCAELARRIVDRLDHDVLVLCGPQERETARRVEQLAGGGRVRSMADGPLDLGTAKACIRRCRLIVSTDSGPRHVAAALGKAAVTLFGPMLPVWSENPTQRAVNLVRDLDCIGCRRRICPKGHHRCMKELTVDMVYDRLVGLLAEETAAAAAPLVKAG